MLRFLFCFPVLLFSLPNPFKCEIHCKIGKMATKLMVSHVHKARKI